MLLRDELAFSWSDSRSPSLVDIALAAPAEPLAQQLFRQFPYDTIKLPTLCHKLIAGTCPYCDATSRKAMASEEELAELHKLSSDYAPNDEVGSDRPSPPPPPPQVPPEQANPTADRGTPGSRCRLPTIKSGHRRWV